MSDGFGDLVVNPLDRLKNLPLQKFVIMRNRLVPICYQSFGLWGRALSNLKDFRCEFGELSYYYLS